jgi:hypothetical protein
LPENLKQNCSFLFQSEVWKVIFDAEKPVIALELRAEESKVVELITVDLFNNSYSEIHSYPGWMSSLVAIHRGKLIVQKYKQGSFPEPHGWVIVDSENHNVEFEGNDGAVGFLSEGLLIITNVLFEKINYSAYDFNSRSLNELTKTEVLNLKVLESKIGLPQQYLGDSIHFNTVKQFIKVKTRKEAVEGSEYFESESKIIVSYYIRAAEKLENFLLVTDNKGNVLMDKLINSNIDKIKKDTFFIKENQLIFIKDKKELQSYVL